MSAVFKTVNQRGNLSITQDHVGYAYLGKYAIDGGGGFTTVTFSCVGMPLVFFSIPYNISDTNPTSAAPLAYRVGVSLAGLVSNGGNSWTAHIFVSNLNNGAALSGLYLRAFGRLADNWPNGSGRTPNLIIRTDAGKMVFDAGVRMLKLAGDTYSTELTLVSTVPTESEAANKYDATVVMPFDMANKSISAAPRSTIAWPYFVGAYTNWETNQYVEQYDIYKFYTAYAASGNNLLVKRIGVYDRREEYDGGLSGIGSTGVSGYSRLAVIDNTKFP
jgi:hypothetical protein